MTFSLTLLTQFLEDMEAYSEVGDHLLHMLVLYKLEYKGIVLYAFVSQFEIFYSVINLVGINIYRDSDFSN